MMTKKIEDYKLPTLKEAPPNKAPWAIDPKRSALLIHDMQLYFLDFFISESRVRKQLLENIETLLAIARKKGMPVIYTAQPGNMGARRGLLRDIWGPGMTTQPAERDIHPQVAPHSNDPVLTKWRYSAFHQTSLGDQLAENHISQLIIVGIFAHIGCLVSAIDAYSRDIEVFMPLDAVADFDRARHMMAISYASANCAVVTDTSSAYTAISTGFHGS